jgi:hypothetical protein
MPGKAIDASGQQCNLNLGRSGIALRTLEISDDLRFVGSSNCHL